MGKVRHRKRTRDARISATAAPLVGTDSSTTTTASTATDDTLSTPGHQAKDKKGSKRDQEISTLLDKLRSTESRERVWAASTLSSLLLTLPPLQHRLLLSRNLIGLLIERLTLPLPSSSSSSSPPAPPPSDDLTVAIESLGSLRNLAVSSPPHILSEMHNKRLLLPLTSIHLPLLAAYLPLVVAPAPAPLKPNLLATPAERERVDLANEAQETLRAGYWDWAENVLVLLWSLAESNTKILAALNAHGEAIVKLCVGFLSEDRLGIEKVGVEGVEMDGMDVEAGKKHKKKDAAGKGKKGARVPLFVAVAAAQSLHAFLSSNPPSHTHLLASHGAGFSPSLSHLLSILLTSSFPSASSTSAPSASSTTSEDWSQLRVLAFGSLLELAKSRSKRRDIETVREVLRSPDAQNVLLSLVSGASAPDALPSLAERAKAFASEIDPTVLPSSRPKEGTPEAGLVSLERQAQTLQLALEVLGEWLASGVPNSAAIAGGDVADADAEDEAGMVDEEEDEEEWGGISMEMDGGEDEGMDEDDEDEPEDGIIRKTLPGEGDDAMLDDLPATAAGGDDSDSDDEDAKPAIQLLGGSLPLQLLALSQPTILAFLPPAAFSSPLTRADSAPTSSLIPSSTAQSVQLPAALTPLSEALTTVSVRAVEALNNLYVTLARAKARRSVRGEVQSVFETTLGMMHAALAAAAAESQFPAAAAVVQAEQGGGGKKKKGGASTAAAASEEVDEIQERRMEVVMAGAGVVWGCVRLGLDPDSEEQLVIGPDTLPFLLTSLYPSAFASAPTPAGESIRVRTLGALGWLGRRRGVPVDENRQVGAFLLQLVPLPAAQAQAQAAGQVAGTPDILLQAIDSFIDLYADEEREYDVPVFREGGMLEELEARVGGVRAAIKKIDRNKFPELRSRADGALENLVAFVGYRKEVVRPKPAAGRRR
ncbi:hypothetical protein JCM6882_002275 [Rhodosporidiobolus microsporus]